MSDMKKNIRMVIDLAMTVLLPVLMAYSLVGEALHEVIGTGMLALFLAHNALNRGFYKALFKGRYTARRVFQTVIDLFLLVFMLLQPLSGIAMSKHLYTFIQIPGITATAREIHLLLAYWGFVLLCLHAGTHLAAPLGRLKRRKQSAWISVIAALAAASVYGCFAFVKRQLADYMLLKSAFVFFDFSEPRLFFFLDYLTIMVLFAFIGCLIAAGLRSIEKSHLSGGTRK